MKSEMKPRKEESRYHFGGINKGKPMSKQLLVHYEGNPCYHIFIENDFASFLHHMEGIVGLTYRKVCIVSDSEVAKIYLNEMENICKERFEVVESFVFPNGEASKNLETVEKLYQKLINCHFDRKDLLIALGGGVVGDLTGFTASTYLRGIDFIQVPTTLLSQVDSSIGGKTGVDFLQYKNMVGAFYMPRMVYINTSVLRSLPKEQFSSGMGEVIKHGLIKNAAYYEWLKVHHDEICDLKPDVVAEMIFESCKIKKTVVEEDPKEQSIRVHLNFGHTLGHAIEKLSDFSLYHGECVAIGMHGAAYLSLKNHGITQNEYQDILNTIQSFGLPISIQNYVPDEILAATKSDKKMDGANIKFVILEHIGEAVVNKTYTDEALLDAISMMIE